MDISKYSKKDMEEILSLSYPYCNKDVRIQADTMVENLCQDSNLSVEEKGKYEGFINDVKMLLLVAESPKKRSASELINPMKRETVVKTVNIDSRFRDNYYKTESSDFTVRLPMVIKNVLSMKMQDISLPNNIYSIHRKLGNNYFHIKKGVGDIEKITIEDGIYTREEMQNELNMFNQGDPTDSTKPGDDYIFTIDARSNKTIIDGSDAKIELYFNRTFEDGSVDNMRSLQQGLGWLLGFRYGEYKGETSYISEGIFDATTPDYIFLEVDDHNNNINNNFIGAFNSSIINNNILERLNRSLSGEGNTFIATGSVLRYERNYFGPVNINNLHIRLLDEFGRVIPMNNMDFSFLLEFKCVYEV